ncbi:MAG TPA: 23S rRNA (adenine(2503)-C(2))-methyltransferase RlmN [Kiritimatiellia bacterium]|nr:23S rRNA (adenine(2503)-C(2))-methyltransferase RlmN [Kiritimatiellia bacterium]HRZ11991.1 23S rRNA (adenine(2503)-C(2))-methyltransferase RlmN [Kiritimatiellia bacterium]HSA17203.1 23S rRNA (adenine(2503)-C(2))-methyltransferase RlmN [Kiritimatiellia bacterium]
MKDRAPAIHDMSASEIEALLREWRQPAYRARQIYRQLYAQLAAAPGEMSDLPAALRERLAQEVRFNELELDRVQTGDGGLTRKALFRVNGGPPVEAVLMIYRDRATVCVSTQSGCAMACRFCATGRMGFRLNLTAGQMVEQVLWAAREARAAPAPGKPLLTNVVYMGMGEPFNNYDRWWASVERLHDPEGFNLGARNFTVSTVGIVPGILRLAREKLPVNLALSLHAPDDELRSQLVPVNRKYPVAEVIEAVREYTDKTSRRVSFEYVLLQGVNDQPARAQALARLLKGTATRPGVRLCHVNLIPWNPVPGEPLKPSERQRVLDFQAALERHRIACTVRVQRGVDIAAACGQLAGGVQ